MKINNKLLTTLYLVAGTMMVALLIINLVRPEKEYTSPLGETFSVLSSKDERNSKHVVYGFLPYWKLNKSKYIQTSNLTDIAYFALTIEADGSIRKYGKDGIIDPGWNQWENSSDWQNLVKRARADGTRLSLTIISHEDDNTREFLNCRKCWDVTLVELISEMKKQGVTNLNVDFELVKPDAEESLSLKYSQFVNFLNTNLDKEFGDSYVVVSTLPDSMYKPRLTDAKSLENAADALFIMAYDFHRPTSDNAGPVAPIGGIDTHYEYDVSTMLNDYLKEVEPEKLILGVPYYGYNWLVSSRNANAQRIPGNDYLGYSVSQTYENIMEVKLENNLQEIWDVVAKVPYLTYVNAEKQTLRQVYFENYDSLSIKYKIAKNKNLAGVGIWALGYDGGYQELWDLIRVEFFNE